MKDIAIFGAGGFGREVACLIRRINENLEDPCWKLIGFFDDGLPIGSTNEYGSILGDINVLNTWDRPLAVVIAIGNPDILQKVVGKITNKNIFFPNLLDPSVICLDPNNYSLGKGNIICANCLLSCNVSIGDFNIFNGYIPVGHDTVIGSYNVIMPTTNISGGVKVGNCNFFGVKSVVLQYITIGNNTRIGACSVVIRKTKDGFLYMGNPATKVII